MALRVIKQIRSAIHNLNPDEVREMAEQQFSVGLLASEEAGYERLRAFLIPPEGAGDATQRAAQHILRVQQPADLERCDFGLTDSPVDGIPHFYAVDPEHQEGVIEPVLDRHKDLWVPLARHFVAFRRPVADRLIQRISLENAAFAAASALPNIAPNLFELPWAVGEFASDTAVLTVNQVRLAFLLAAAYGKPVGYLEQKAQLATIVGSAFGWRALARELVGKIPFGGGLVPKALVAFSGTYVLGLGVERYLRLGRTWTSLERREARALAHERGRAAVIPMLRRGEGGVIAPVPSTGPTSPVSRG